MHLSIPRLLVAGLRGGGGKTLLSLGLAATWRRQDVIVAPFKKGPDYIDAAWLSLAAGRPCRNLDLFLLSTQAVVRSFDEGSRGANVALIEGNRGLFDGMDPEGSYSTAELAKLLKVPVVLSVDVTKTTRTAAAAILGCQTLDPEVPIRGVVLNRSAGARHESVLRQAIEGICGIPVLGAIPKLGENILPERHLGLVPPQETSDMEAPLERVAEVARSYLDLDAILALARGPEVTGVVAGPTRVVVEMEGNGSEAAEPAPVESAPTGTRDPVRIGVFRDAAFQFYYPENLEALEAAGATLEEISPLEDAYLPTMDALYLGGGFPETLAVGLSENTSFMDSLKEAAGEGMPIYAECGGAVYLGRGLHYDGREFPLAGILPVEYGFQARPKGHGYTVLEAVETNPYFPKGETLRGHEFHYSYLLPSEGGELSFAFRVHRGFGFDGRHDGLTWKKVLATYTHLHALGAVGWAPALVEAGREFGGRGRT